MDLPMGTVLAGRYRVMARLGEGGMGSVYQVEDLSRPATVWAVKELLDDTSAPPEELAQARKRFDAEIALMRRLAHPRIPAFGESFSEDGRRYFAMEFVPGANLEERLERARAPLPERDVLGWMIAICDVLAYLHGQRPPIIVRDLKPGNIMVTPGGETRLIDFGIARTYKPGQLSNTENLGTMTYASPEHLGHTQTDARSDIYSLGATMFHLLTNSEPTPMETPAPGTLRRYQRTISEATESIVIRAMQLDPARRFQSAAALRVALEHALAALTPVPAAGARARQATVLPHGASATAIVPAPRPASTRAAESSVGRPTQPGVICPRCGHLNRHGARFCARDGVGLWPANTFVAPGPAVGGEVPAGARGAVSTAELSERRAQEAFAAGRYAQTVRQCEDAVAQGRATQDVYLLLGRALRLTGRAEEAASAFAGAARLRPAAESYYQEGMAWREAGMLPEAQLAFTRARQLDPRDHEVSYQLGLVCLDLGQLAQAEGELREALALRSDHVPSVVALGRVCAARKHWQEAAELFRQALALDQADAAAHLELGRVLLAQHRPNEAVRAMEQAAQLAPDSAEIQTALGMCCHAVGRRAQAREALRRAVALDPHDEEARQLLKHV